MFVNKLIDRLLPWALFAFVLAVYAVTLSPYVHLEDDGGFILAAYFNGVAHPPGYPLYVIIGHIFSWFDISTVAARIHFVSAFFGALTVVFVYAIVRILVRNSYPALLSALILAFSEQFWSQSIIAEVYTLNACIFFAMFYCLLKIHQQKIDIHFSDGDTGNTWLFLAAFFCGLGLTNHWPLFVLSSIGLVFFVLSRWKKVLANLHKLILFLLLGMLPYLWMYHVAGQQGTFITFGEISSLSEMLFYVSRKGYADVDHSLVATMDDKFSFLLFILQEIRVQFLWLLLVVPVGIVILLKEQRVVALALVGVVLGNTLLLVALLGFDYDGFHCILFRPYLLVSYAALSIFIGVALSYILAKLQRLSLFRFSAFTLLLFPLIFLVSNYASNDRGNDAWAEDFAHEVLEALPQNAILFVNQDVGTGPFGYMHYVKRFRPDIDLYQASGLLYPDRLFHPYRQSGDDQVAILEQFIKAQSRPVYTVNKLPVNVPQVNMGVVWSLNGSPELATMPFLNDWIESQLMLSGSAVGWVDLHKIMLAKGFIDFYGEQGKLTQLAPGKMLLLTSSLETKVAYLDWLMRYRHLIKPAYYGELIRVIDKDSGQFLLKIRKSRYLYLKAMYYADIRQQKDLAAPYFLDSVRLNPDPQNPSVRQLFQWYVIQHDEKGISNLAGLTGIQFEY